MRIGYFGGTFDPPHSAHLRLATLAADTFALDVVYLAPTGLQPLKDQPPEADFADRLAMTRLLCGADARLQATDLDAPRADGSPNYTINALEAVRQRHPGAALFALAGADSFLTLRQWRSSDRLLELAEWIVVSRPGVSIETLSTLALTEQQQARVHLLQAMDDPLSASELRSRLRAGVSCGNALPPAVMLYIARMHLYHAGPRRHEDGPIR